MKPVVGLSIFILAACVAVLAATGVLADIAGLVIGGDIAGISQYVQSYGNWAIAFSILIGVLVNLSGLPTVAYSGANGIVFGLWTGFGLSWTAEIVGATLALFLTRGLLSRRSYRYIERHRTLKKLYDFSGERGFLALLVARVLPFTPSGLLNIAAAVSKISFRDYLLATAIGKIPSVLAEVYVGRDLFFPWENQARLLLWAVLLGGLYLYWRLRRRRPADNKP